MTGKAEVFRETIYRQTFASRDLIPLNVWRFRVPLTGLCGGASDWQAAIKRVCESLTEHQLRGPVAQLED